MKTTKYDPSKKFVVLRGLKHNNVFITMSNGRIEEEIITSTSGEIWYEILGSSDSVEEGHEIMGPETMEGQLRKGLFKMAVRMTGIREAYKNYQ